MTANFRTIGFPDHLFRIAAGTFDLENFQTSSDSILSRFIRVAGMIEQRWACQLEFATMAREAWQEWKSFRARLSGQAILFEMRAPAQELPLGAGAGFSESGSAQTITGTTITGTTILQGGTSALVLETAPRYAQAVMLGFGADMAGDVVMKHGDLFGLGGNLYMSVGNVTADASGEARVPFRWRLWKGAAIGDIVQLRHPTCRVQLRSANVGPTQLSVETHGRAGYEAIEVPYL